MFNGVLSAHVLLYYLQFIMSSLSALMLTMNFGKKTLFLS